MTDMPVEIATAIAEVMKKVKNVEKKGENTFHRYMFARVEDLLFQVQPAMAEHGLVLTQDELEVDTIRETILKAKYAFTLSHTSGKTWACPVHQSGMSSFTNSKGGLDDKALNKCHTAARKYFILGLFQIPAGDLPDADTEEDKPHEEAPKIDVDAWKGAINGCADRKALAQWLATQQPTLDKAPDAVYTDIKQHYTARWTALKPGKATQVANPVSALSDDEIPY